ncbi:flavocytochrome c [Levilactobacillus bambusae]|uniref:Flavocytochrome c n=1 Tax=Levilactobacillus bambusae TaxID=2024736 RepID=A0A2V1MYY7_9LACO|nr:flavocytochrome c [Levilactobacillus bambusae]PWG00189.1 flavocytochrome c [Levilactobacillus bambusae]
MADKFRFEPTAHADLKTDYDMVIIGSGAAGLTSAIQAFELGLHPVILEKMDKIGGNTTRASSGMNAAETSTQLSHQIVDSMDAFYNETFVGGGKKNNPELLRYFTDHSALAIEWLKDHDIPLEDITITGGMKTPRAHRPASTAPIGGYLETNLLKVADKDNLEIFTDVTATKLMTDASGDITGVEVELDGTKKTLNSPIVVLATGGFGANPKLIGQYRPDLEHYKTTNQPGATGDGISLATQIGAGVVDMDQVQVHPTVQQDFDHTFLIGEAVRGEGAILVNADGSRFVNELDTRKNVTAAINNLPEKSAYLIFDQNVRDRAQAIEFYDHVGLVTTGETIDDLADKLNMAPETLTATINRWNKLVEEDSDSDFSRDMGMHQFDKAPYFAIHIAPAVHYTMGGLKINAQTQVQKDDGTVINGLFAAGEIAGGLHGDNRIGGNSIAETVIFGRQAGQQAYKYSQK